MNKILQQIGATLMALFGPIHDFLLKPEENPGTVYGSESLQSASAGGYGSTADAKTSADTVNAYIGGTTIIVLLVSMFACGKLGKKKRVRRRRRASAPARRRRTYRRRK